MEEDTANFVQRCWQKDPDSRPPIQDCVEFFRAKVDATRPLEEEANFIRRQVNDETILVLGGGGEDNHGNEMLILKENKWIKLSLNLPKKLNSGGAVYLDGEIYIFGGWKFIICGGRNDGWNNFLKSVECFDPKSGVWTELSDLPSPRHGPSLVSYSNSLILMGGGDGKRYLNSVLELNNLEKRGTWTELPPMNFSRCDFSSALLDNEIFVIGGNYRKGVEIFDGQNWRDGPPLPYVCGRASSIIIPQNLTDALCNCEKNQDDVNIFKCVT